MVDEQRELLERLDHFALKPKVILDVDGRVIGAGDALRRRFPQARLIAAQNAPHESLKDGARVRSNTLVNFFGKWWPRRSPVEYVDMTATQLPLEDHSVDVVLARRWTPGIDALDASLRELHRVLVTGGLLLCTTPSPTSVAGQADMLDLGSALMRAGFVEPVLDVDRVGPLQEEIIHVAAFAGEVQSSRTAGETVVPFPSTRRRG